MSESRVPSESGKDNEVDQGALDDEITPQSSVGNGGPMRKQRFADGAPNAATWNVFPHGVIFIMMRRTPWFRALATYLAVWFPLVVGEPGIVQPCPMHGGVVTTASTAPSPSHSHHGVGAGQTGHADHAPASAPTHDHHACTCIGACAGSAAVALTTAAPGIPAATVAFRPASILPRGERLARPAPYFARPYTTGPPRA
jgi:hypothetical protein